MDLVDAERHAYYGKHIGLADSPCPEERNLLVTAFRDALEDH